MLEASVTHPLSRDQGAVREVLTLRLGTESYGIDILCVQEIRSFERPTRIAGAPEYFLGVTDLRGVIVPIVDLRRRFGLDPIIDGNTVTVVLSLGPRTVGVVVDGVSDVLELRSAQIKPAPPIGGAIDSSHITGIATLGQDGHARTLILIDIASLLVDLGMAQAMPALAGGPALALT